MVPRDFKYLTKSAPMYSPPRSELRILIQAFNWVSHQLAKSLWAFGASTFFRRRLSWVSRCVVIDMNDMITFSALRFDGCWSPNIRNEFPGQILLHVHLLVPSGQIFGSP
jgi:hypothetical protein